MAALTELIRPETGELTPEVNLLLSFFRKGYGERYLGDRLFTEDYLDRADRVVLVGDGHDPKAVALIRASRLTAVATSPDRDRFCPRRLAMVELLRASRAVQPDGWVTIHSSAIPMQKAALEAGMAPLHNEARLAGRIHDFGELDMHSITPSPQGLIVERAGSHHGSDYLQHAWGWED